MLDALTIDENDYYKFRFNIVTRYDILNFNLTMDK